jgi:hypothetical protein
VGRPGDVGRVRAVLGDLLEHDPFFFFELVRREDRVEEHVGLDVEALLEELLLDQEREEGVVLAGRRVVVGAVAVDLVVELALGARLGAVEEEVLEEVRGAVHPLGLVDHAGVDQHRGGHHRIGAVLDQDHPQAVVEDLLVVGPEGGAHENEGRDEGCQGACDRRGAAILSGRDGSRRSGVASGSE